MFDVWILSSIEDIDCLDMLPSTKPHSHACHCHGSSVFTLHPPQRMASRPSFCSVFDCPSSIPPTTPRARARLPRIGVRDGQTNGIKLFIPFVCSLSIPPTTPRPALARLGCSRRTDEWDKIYPIRLSVVYPSKHTARRRSLASDRCSTVRHLYPSNHTACPRSLASDRCSRQTDKWSVRRYEFKLHVVHVHY